jgi:hypothetical protein
MPGLQTVLGQLNTAFGREGIDKLAEKRESFAPGKPLAAGVVVHSKMALYDDWVDYIKKIPLSMQEALRATIYHALSAKPPVQVTFAWAPGYDYELTIWQAPDTRKTKGGITVLIKSRYPDDKHPLHDEPPHGS